MEVKGLRIVWVAKLGYFFHKGDFIKRFEEYLSVTKLVGISNRQKVKEKRNDVVPKRARNYKQQQQGVFPRH